MFSWKIKAFDQLTSTMEEAKRLLEASDESQEGVVILAKEQTAGRGRYQRPWVSPEGNLYVSFIVNLTKRGFIEGPYRLSDLAFVAALATGEVLKSLSPNVTYKWPNDLLLSGKKVSGTLIEAFETEKRGLEVVIGIGVNLISFPESLSYSTTSLREEGGPLLSPPQFLEKLLKAFEVHFKLWIEQGFAPLREKWLESAAYKGGEISIKLTESCTLKGIFLDLDSEGYLILKTTTGLEKINTGDVLFGS